MATNLNNFDVASIGRNPQCPVAIHRRILVIIIHGIRATSLASVHGKKELTTLGSDSSSLTFG